MRIRILVPVVLFGCLYAGIASAKGPHAAMSRSTAQAMHAPRADAPAAAAAPIRAEMRRHSETMTQRSGTSINRSEQTRRNNPIGNTSPHQQFMRDALMNMLPTMSEATPVVEGDDGVTAAVTDQATA